MITEMTLDKSHRVVLTSAVRRAAGIPEGQKLRAHVAPGRIVIEVPASTTGKVLKRGKLKVWTGEVPFTPLEDAVEQARHYTRCDGGGICDSLHATFARRKKAAQIVMRNPSHFVHVAPGMEILVP